MNDDDLDLIAQQVQEPEDNLFYGLAAFVPGLQHVQRRVGRRGRPPL